MGSGKLLGYAIKLYGIENFHKEILHVFDNEDEMNRMEAEIVNEEFIMRDDVYNICVGGQGGFSYVNKHVIDREHWSNNRKITNDKHSHMLDEWGAKGGRNSKPCENFLIASKTSFSGKSHTDETKEKIRQKNSLNQSGSGNSQFGKMWITNGIDNMKISRTSEIPQGWSKGRKMK
jgi:N-methylhydantoinase B/oxoprolinase/acetone carboxylase alpha subunit